MSVTTRAFSRLPSTVVPTNYDILWRPDLVKCTFTGEETVTLKVSADVSCIKLNAKDITLSDVKFSSGSVALASSNITMDPEEETAVITFPSSLPQGDGQLHIAFSGELNDKLKGFYRSKYTGADGEVKYSAVTQFESTDARRAFPCWDEPAVKATFDVSLLVPKHCTALSNMPVVSSSDADCSNHVVKFQRSPIMSTYLLAVVVGEYDYVEDTSTDGVKVRVYTPKGKSEQGNFALEVATKVLPYYKEYFQIPYPLPKMDLIAIPDFSVGAMENWGLVTYRETCLLVDPVHSSAISKQFVAIIVGHELAHQWFGNLVTMEWWTNLWLNEGYASFTEYLSVDHLFPKYNIWSQFVTDTYIPALEFDSLRSSHPIEVPVGHPSEVDEIFDEISYNKGASVIRMLHEWIGEKDFKSGMNGYLTLHQYGNTVTDDLWTALAVASDKPIKEVMSGWTLQTGFPLIRVTSHNDVITLTQERFLADGNTQGDTSHWMVPIKVVTSTGYTTDLLLDSKSKDITLPAHDWFKLNPGTIGFYRTHYPAQALTQLIPAIKNNNLPPLDRLGLLDDLFAMVSAGYTPAVEGMKLLEAFICEENYTVWDCMNNAISKLSLLTQYTDCHDKFKLYVINIMSKITDKVGWNKQPDEGHQMSLLRSLVLSRMGVYGYSPVVCEATRRFEAHMSGTELIPADLRAAVYRTVMTHGDEKTMEQMLKLYRQEELHEEKNRITRSLGATKDPNLLQRVLEFAMSSEVRSQDTPFVIIGCTSTKQGRQLCWEFYKNNWEEFNKRYEGGFMTGRIVKRVTENFATSASADEVEQFFVSHVVPSTRRTVEQSVESIRLNASWVQRDAKSVTDYLTSHV